MINFFRLSRSIHASKDYNLQNTPSELWGYDLTDWNLFQFFHEFDSLADLPMDKDYQIVVAAFAKRFQTLSMQNFNYTSFFSFVAHNIKDMLVR